MVECFKCGIIGDKVRLFDAISDEGIVKVCEKCAFEENLPIIKRPFDSFSKSPELRTQESRLRDIIDKKYTLREEKRNFPDLIENFHWIIMRARRIKHMTQEQLGKELGESEKTIKLAERGILPTNYSDFISKIEEILNIRIFSDEARKMRENQEKKLGFDPLTLKSLTISDLQDIKNKKEENSKEYSIDSKSSGNKFSFNKKAGEGENKPEFVQENKEDLSQEEIDKIIFGK